MASFEDTIGNAFGDVVCDKLQAADGPKPFASKDACECGTVRNADGWTENAAKTHKCQARKPSSRRTQATRSLSAGTTFATKSEVTVEMTAADKVKLDAKQKAITEMTVTEING